MLDYMLENDYSLRDWTGYATTWGRWAPRGAHQLSLYLRLAGGDPSVMAAQSLVISWPPQAMRRS